MLGMRLRLLLRRLVLEVSFHQALLLEALELGRCWCAFGAWFAGGHLMLMPPRPSRHPSSQLGSRHLRTS